jgi:Icc-related predicted phosphoesterase
MRITIISDWHGNFDLKPIRGTDIICVCGDMLRNNKVHKYEKWLASLPAKYVLVIPGNHDIPLKTEFWQPSVRPEKVINPIATPFTYEGIKFGGICWSSGDVDLSYIWAFTTYNMAFLKEKMNKVPACDILLSHCPPSCREMLIGNNIDIGHPSMIDWAIDNNCKHIFCGHIHEHSGKQIEVAGVKVHNAACTLITVEI